jgi:hypothetical protein
VNDSGEPFLNGIDHLEVSPTDQTQLLVHFIHPLPGEADGVPTAPVLTKANFTIEGGTRVPVVQVDQVLATAGDVITLQTDVAGDHSTYVLRLVSSPAVDDPPAGFDLVLAEVPFSFKVNCENDLDCAIETECHDVAVPAPHLDYLAKDYASFRRLLLDRLSETMPGWQERSPADLGVALVEVLAYAGDHLSYHQDSVATEAYLGTARRRTSVRRHARLVDYAVHEGANARAWLVFETDIDRGNVAAPAVPAGTVVAAAPDRTSVTPTSIRFETMDEVTTLTVARNEITLHTWGESECCLPAGATRATLVGSPTALGLVQGDLLVFEEVRGGATGRPEDADRTHRHAVRLSANPRARLDEVTATDVSDVTWSADDALPFPLCLNVFDDGAGGTVPAAVARANVVLADHGGSFVSATPGSDLMPALVPVGRRYRPMLVADRLTVAGPYDGAAARARPASAALAVDVRSALPVLRLRGEGDTWTPHTDLLGSDRFAPHFVIETEDDGSAHLRFGDDVLGRAPTSGTAFVARGRVGGGASGNVGPESLAAIVSDIAGVDAVRVRNPMAAVGGREPEAIRQVKLDAPQAFRTQERAVTPADYAEAAERHPDVQRAAASRRWTGSWYTMFVTVDRRGGKPVDASFEADLRRFLERFRMAGYDLEIDGPRYVALDLALTVCVLAHHDRAVVHRALIEAFGTGRGPDGRPGFFHPDNFTFGQPVYLSQVLATAMEVPGVDRVTSVDAFHRLGDDPHGEIDQGFLPIHRLEIARLDNDASDPERGRLSLSMKGGI